jgi:GTP-binding protein HflX
LTYTAGGEVVKRFSQKMERPNPKTSLEQENRRNSSLCKRKWDFYPDFDDELTPSQQKNISKIIVECKILDRTHLILIFLHNVQRLCMQERR